MRDYTFRYTEEQKQFLRDTIPGRPIKETARLFSEKFFPLTYLQARAFAKNNHIRCGVDARFPKGHIPATKGRKMTEWASPEAIERSKAGRFKKGNRPHTAVPVGTERNLVGYVEVKVAEPNVWKMKHRVIWEQHYGPIPEGHYIIFKDGNRMNMDISNLAMIDRPTNIRLNQLKLRDVGPELMDTSILIAKLSAEAGRRKRKK